MRNAQVDRGRFFAGGRQVSLDSYFQAIDSRGRLGGNARGLGHRQHGVVLDQDIEPEVGRHIESSLKEGSDSTIKTSEGIRLEKSDALAKLVGNAGRVNYTWPAAGTMNGARYSRVSNASAAALSMNRSLAVSMANFSPQASFVVPRSSLLSCRCWVNRP